MNLFSFAVINTLLCIYYFLFIVYNNFTMTFTEQVTAGSGVIQLLEFETQKLVISLHSSNPESVRIQKNVVNFSFPELRVNYTTWYEIVVDSDAFSDIAGVGGECFSG